jgi:hypothetical protein
MKAYKRAHINRKLEATILRLERMLDSDISILAKTYIKSAIDDLKAAKRHQSEEG